MRSFTKILNLAFVLFVGGGSSVSAVTLGEAIDTTSLVWSTGGDFIWFGTNAPTFDGVDAAVSGSIEDDQTSWLETTVTGPGIISWWWSAETEPVYDQLVFSLNNDDVSGYAISGEQNWEYRSYTITNNGPVSLRWGYTRDGSEGLGANQAYLDQVKFKPGPEIPLSTALNTSSSIAAWTTGGNANPTYWEGQTNVSHVDGRAAESGAIYTSQESWMETTVFGVTNVSFWWKVSSVTDHGWLAFLVNGATNSVITGEVGWQLKTNIAINIGTNTLRWVCRTDSSALGKLNRGWVDEVNFSPTFAPSSSIMLSTPVVADGTAQFTVTNKIGWPVKIYYSTNLAAGEWTLLLSTNTATSATVNVTDPDADSSPVRFYRAQSP